jgi:hypothetical protein
MTKDNDQKSVTLLIYHHHEVDFLHFYLVIRVAMGLDAQKLKPDPAV